MMRDDFSAAFDRRGDRIFPIFQKPEIAVHIVVVERADAGSVPAQRFRSQVKPLADRAGLKIHVAIPAIAERLRRLGQVRDHRNGEAGISCQRLFRLRKAATRSTLPQWSCCKVPLRCIPAVHAGLAIADAVNVEVQRNEIVAGAADTSPAVEIGTRQSAGQSRVAKSRSCSSSPRSMGAVCGIEIERRAPPPNHGCSGASRAGSRKAAQARRRITSTAALRSRAAQTAGERRIGQNRRAMHLQQKFVRHFLGGQFVGDLR